MPRKVALRVGRCAATDREGFVQMQIESRKQTTHSVKKKFKDKKFAAGVNREVILDGCKRLGAELDEVIAECIAGMRENHEALGL